MYTHPEDLVRAHQRDLLDEACRDRSGARLVRAERRRRRDRDAANQARRTPIDLN